MANDPTKPPDNTVTISIPLTNVVDTNELAEIVQRAVSRHNGRDGGSHR
jgi:hypothetical protein